MTQQMPDPSLPWPIPLAAVALIAESEGLRLTAYRCPAGVWTIGYGETDGVHPGDTCTKDEADRWLLGDLGIRARAVEALCTRPPSRNELGALVSLAYNIGVDALRRSTALRLHNAGGQEAAARAITLWDKARVNGTLTVLPGLVARRAREMALYLTPDDPAAPGSIPQAVEAESGLAASPIAQGGTTTVVAGAGTAIVAAAGEQAQEAVGILGHLAGVAGAAKSAAASVGDMLGVSPGVLVGVLLVLAGYWVIRWRVRQRQQGYA